MKAETKTDIKYG